MRWPWILAAGAALLAIGAIGGCTGGQPTSPYRAAYPGDAHAGKKLILSYGCGSCHIVPGIYQARGLVGPPLYFFGRRTMIAGELPNNEPNLVRWLRNPPAIEPGTAMPNLGLNEGQAQDIAAYLERLQ
jgi:cytochrome c